MDEPTAAGSRVEIDIVNPFGEKVILHKVRRRNSAFNWVALFEDDQTYGVYAWEHLVQYNPRILGDDE